MLKVTNLTHRYDDKVLYHDLDLAFAAGKSYALVGPSGAGKSTLLNILSGLVRPEKGTITVDGKPLTPKYLRKLRQTTFGYLFQNYGLMDNATVAENLQLGLYFRHLKPAAATEQMKAVLARLQLNVALDRKIYSLSGGEQQRVALARLLLKQPQIIFADEPTGALDEADAAVITNHLLNDFAKDATIIIATHTPAVMAQCDYQVALRAGQVEITTNKPERE